MDNVRKPGGGEDPGTFSRQASGLMRQASAWNVLGFNVFNLNIGMGALFVLLLIPSLYPKANVYVSILTAALVTVPVIFTFGRLSAVYPRTGGDYVFVSRNVHPAVGFAQNLSEVIFLLFFVGIGGVLTGQYGLGPLFRVMGAYAGSKALVDAGNWFASSTGTFLIAAGVISVFVAIFIFSGLRLYFRIQTVSFIIGMVALVLIVVFGLIASRASALQSIDETLGSIGAGGVAGLAEGTKEGFSWSESFKAAIWPWLYLMGAYMSAFIGSEVKRPARAQMGGMMGALGWGTGWMLAVTWAMMHLFGWAFFANLGNADPTQYGLSSTPSYAELTALGMSQPVLGVLVIALFTVWGYTWMGPLTISISRAMFAWAMDGLAPKWLSRVSVRWASPVNSLLVVLVAGIASAAFFAYGNLSVVVGNINFAVTFALCGLSAVLLPSVNPSLWRSSPGHGTLLGIPVTSLIGALTLPAMAWMIWYQLTDPYSGTSVSGSPRILVIAMVILVMGIPIFYVTRAVQRRRGVNVDYSFNEIPPE